MKRVLIIGFFSFLFSFSFSQTTGSFDFSDGRQILGLGRKSVKSNKNVIGSQYFNDKFLKVTVSGFEDETIYLRYNAVQDEMEFEKGGEIYYVPKNQNMTITFTAPQKVYEYTGYTDKENNTSGYLVLINKGEQYSLYKKEQIKYIPEKEAVNSYDVSRPAEYRKVDDTYFIKIGDTIENFPKNKKELLKKFPNKSSEISDFLKKNKISFSDRKSVV